MRLRNALRVLSDNFSNTFKLLLYRFITGVIFFGLSYAVLSVGLHTITSSVEVKHAFELLRGFFTALFSGETDVLKSFEGNFLQSIAEIVTLLSQNIGSIIGSLIGVIALYLGLRVLNGVAIFAMGSLFHDRMRSYSNTRFSTAIFKNLGRATLYQLIYVPITFVFDMLSVAICWLVCFYAPSVFPSAGVVAALFGLSASIALFIALQSFKMALFSHWIPATISGDGVIGGFKRCFELFKKNFWQRFASFLVSIYLIVIVCVICAFCTLGSFLIIAVPASYLFLLCLQYVFYFEATGRDYYLSRKEIVRADEGEDSEIQENLF